MAGTPNQSEMAQMANRKILCIVIVLTFSMSLFASGAFARANCDMEHCKHHSMTGLQYAHAKVNVSSMGCCAGTQSDPCDLEKSQIPKINDCTLSLARVDNVDPSNFIAIKSDHAPEDLSLKVFGPNQHTATASRSAPIYIQNASLIF